VPNASYLTGFIKNLFTIRRPVAVATGPQKSWPARFHRARFRDTIPFYLLVLLCFPKFARECAALYPEYRKANT
jgi:hypothetical protein